MEIWANLCVNHRFCAIMRILDSRESKKFILKEARNATKIHFRFITKSAQDSQICAITLSLARCAILAITFSIVPLLANSDNLQDSRLQTTNPSHQESQTLSSYLFFNGSSANRSGLFFGFEVGYIKAKGEESLGIINLSEERGGANWGVMLGYAYFFSNYFGMRIYGSLNASHIKFNDYSTNLNTLLTTLNWGMNADLIANFVALRNFDMGVYVGVFLGANTFLEVGYFEYIARVSKNNGFKVNHTCFDVALNAGLRMVLARSVWLEIALRVPFLKSYAVNESAYRADLSYMGEYKIAFKPNYSASFRLLYQF